ncbi:hypothetical protein FXF51_11250 [Nonomuraea sp. PA05]|uniref:hypothetical protein n=1 Tax=Nonomuraea sp. PA05 TaxID=2604466 RepID=UPI0011D5E09B|nr:hypothetical protein [Nonomuraea sp. PA05]TYB68423.1 hypothetical protein FXF51_11250 [Nonomuraea sp. PA05]
MDIGNGADMGARRERVARLLERSQSALRRAEELQLNADASWQRLAIREADARERLERLRADGRTSGAVGRFLLPCMDYADPRDVAATALRAALELTGADMGDVQLLDGAEGGLTIVVQQGLRPPFLDVSAVVRDGVVRDGVAREVERELAETPVGRVLLDAEARTVHATPVLDDQGALLGMMSIHYRTVRDLTMAERGLLRVLTHRLGRLLQATRLPPLATSTL